MSPIPNGDRRSWPSSCVRTVLPRPISTPTPCGSSPVPSCGPHPDHVVFRDELPSTATGKILRRVLVDELTLLQRKKQPEN